MTHEPAETDVLTPRTRTGGLKFPGVNMSRYPEVLTPEAIDFVVKLEREFRGVRKVLLDQRAKCQRFLDAGVTPDFLPTTRSIRNDPSWRVAAAPPDLENRRVEITGPVERKMMINALNSGAQVFMADFEDANSPTWDNLMRGHINLQDVVNRTISYTNTDGKQYVLKDEIATLMVRPRGWHLDEKHVVVDGEPISASLFDFGLYFFHNARSLMERGTGPYYYLPKLESHLEARLWNDVFTMGQDELGIPRNTIKATVLVETILAAFEMEEILYELRDHIVALNAGRWDYLFSIIKKFRNLPDFVFPDRNQLTMTVSFMRAYTELLVQTSHRRGAHAIGGMAAFIPSRRDPEVNERALAKVREDKVREAADGFDGTWVAHPDLVAIAREPFDKVLGNKPHQKGKLRNDVNVSAKELLNFVVQDGQITETGLRNNINVGIQYIEAWLGGMGAAGINNLMEDVATAEIVRSQVWQWLHHTGTKLDDGREITLNLCRTIAMEELGKIKAFVGVERFSRGRYEFARQVFDKVATSENFVEFLTLEAYKNID